MGRGVRGWDMRWVAVMCVFFVFFFRGCAIFLAIPSVLGVHGPFSKSMASSDEQPVKGRQRDGHELELGG